MILKTAIRATNSVRLYLIGEFGAVPNRLPSIFPFGAICLSTQPRPNSRYSARFVTRSAAGCWRLMIAQATTSATWTRQCCNSYNSGSDILRKAFNYDGGCGSGAGFEFRLAVLVETADGVHIRCVVAPRQREFVFFSDGNSEHRRHVVGAFDDRAFFHFCLVFGVNPAPRKGRGND